MLNQLAQMDMSIYFQSIFFLIITSLLMRLHWKIGSVLHITVHSLRYMLFVLVFLYLFLNWASDVNPSLRNSSILIMTLINIYLLWNLGAAALELPYRRSLRSCVEGVCTTIDLEQAFTSGKRYYGFRFFWSALTSGMAPWHYLSSVAAERTRDDLHRVFISLDPKSSVFGSNLYFHFLKHQLCSDKSMAADKRLERQRAIEALSRDAWMSEKTGAFLHHLLASPQDLLEAGLKESLKAEGKLV